MNEKELTPQEIEAINKDANEFINNLKEETKNVSPEEATVENPKGTPVTAKVIINPDTGENIILGNQDVSTKSFDDLVKEINENGDADFGNTKPICKDDLEGFIKSDSFKEISKDKELSDDAIIALLEIVNKRLAREKFNIYKAFPQEVKDMVDDYIRATVEVGTPVAMANGFKNTISEALIDEFITNIQLERCKSDFAVEMQHIYESSMNDLSTAAVEYMDERNKLYREAANDIEDPDKRKRLTDILDVIDEALNLTKLKEFAKKCKIKPIELDKPDTRAYSGFINKYADSTNNIYDINIAKKAMIRNLAKEPYNLTAREIDAFLICFCKQTINYCVDNVLDHAYMYYVIYNCAMLDSAVSSRNRFKENIKEVIENLKTRNKI